MVITPSRMAIAFSLKNQEFAAAGIREKTGHNDGPEIDKVEAVWGMKGEPYCAMGQYYAFAKAYVELKGIKLTPGTIVKILRDHKAEIAQRFQKFSPLVSDMFKAAKVEHTWREFEQPSDMTKIADSDLVCFNFGSESKPQNHIGMFVRHDTSHLWLVEWNTSSVGSEGGNDPGGVSSGCFLKHREPDPSVITGWIHWSGHN